VSVMGLQQWPSNQSMKPTPKEFASWLAPFQCKFSMFATTPSISSRFPAYAPASASILFPLSLFAAKRRDSLVRLKLSSGGMLLTHFPK
jgi:hypothetical protein